MRRILRFPLQSLVAVVTILALSIPAAPALGQGTSTAQITVDVPASGSSVANGSRVLIGGWAVDSTGPGTGVDMVQAYLDGEKDKGGTLLGTATSGGNRPDVAQALGNPAFDKSGFDFFWTPTNVTNGNHTLYVYAHSVTPNSWSYKTVTVSVTGGPPERGGDRGRGRMGYGRMSRGMTDEIGMRYPDDLYMRGGQGRACIAIFPPPPGCPPPPPPPPPPFLPPPPPQYFPPSVSGLPAPASVLPIAQSPTSVTLIWSPVPGAASYRVLRVTGTGTTPVPVINVTPVSATVSGLTPATAFTFQVVAVDALGIQGTPSAPVTVTTPL